MKSFKQIVLGVILTLGAFTTVTYTACNKDECKDVVCQNGGTCSGGNCTCPTGYEGTHCETAARDKFVKSWSANETTTGAGGGTTLAYTATVVAGTDITSVNIGNLANGFFASVVKATVAGTTITINNQSPDNDGYFVQGSGTYAAGKISWNYSITKGTSVVTATGTWQ